MTLQLRDYQKNFFARVRERYDAGVTRQLGVLATGLGKAVLFAALREQMNFTRKIMVLVHREELAAQAADKLQRWNSHLHVGVEMADRYADVDGIFPATLIVASVPTLGRRGSRRIAKFLPEDFDAVISDEAHHSSSPQWRNVLEHFGLTEPGGSILSLGLTATPNRSDGTGLRQNFDEIVFDMGIREGIESGYLVDLRGIRVNTKTNLDKVKTRAGDFAEDELADAVNTVERNAIIVKEWMAAAYGLKTVVFTVDIQHAVDLAAAFTKCGVDAAAVWGSDADRKAKLQRHRSGQVPVLCNCAVLCLDLETEVLTDKGWARWDQMTMAHKVANWNCDGTVFFEEPKEIVVRPLAATEHMVSVATPRANFRVTNTHRMIVTKGADRDGWKKVAAQELRHGHVLPGCGVAEPFPFERPSGPSQFSSRRVAANAYNLRRIKGISYSESHREAWKRERARNQLTTKSPAELTVYECRFIGFWIADGSRNSRKARGGIEYTLSQSTAYPAIIAWVDELLERMGVNVVRKDNSHYDNPHIRWSLCRGTGGGSLARKGIYHLEPYLKKNGTPLFWGLREQQFDALVEGYWYGDGKHGDARKGFPKNPSFADTKKDWIELLSAIGAVRGWKCSTSPVPPRKDNHSWQWSLRMIKEGRYSISNETAIKHETYSPESVWCVKTTSKNIITRRKGRVVVMGNTEGYDDPGIKCIVLAKPTKSALLFTQMIGRGTRIDDGKSDCLILDVVDSTTKHSLVTMPSLLGLPANLDLKGKSVIRAKEQFERVAKEFPSADLSGVLSLSKLDSIAENISLFQVHYPPEISQLSELGWRKSGDGYMLAVKRDLITITKDLRDEYQIVGNLEGQVITLSAQNLPGAFNIADGLVSRDLVGLLRRDSRWRGDKPTEKQLDLCRILKIEVPLGVTKGQISAAIDAKRTQMRSKNATSLH